MKISRMHFIRFFISGLLSILLLSCSRNSIPIDGRVSIGGKLLSFPTAYYQSVVYVDGQLLAFTRNDVNRSAERVSYAYEGGRVLHFFNPQHIEKCENFIGYSIKGVLPDGRIGFLGCGETVGSNWSIFALDWQTAEVEQLVKGPLTEGYQSKDFTWNPDMTRGVQEMVGGYQGTLYWISPEGISPMDVKIEDQGLTWNLKDYYEGKERTGLVRFPSWSPDGKTIAFFVSTYGIREEPIPKMNIRYELYFMDSSELKPVQILQGIADAFRLRWSSDSKYLLFDGCVGRRLKCGLWLFSLEDKSLSLIAEGEFQDFLWITHKKVVAIKNIALPYDDNQIWEYSIE